MSAPTRTVLVTGSAKRLGREIALALARVGWQVAVHYRDSLEDATHTSSECTRLSGNSASFRANLGNEAAVRNLLPRVIAHFGHLDALVNSASTFEHDAPASFSFAAMEKHMRSNTGAAILLSQALHKHVQERQATDPSARGAVVNLLDQKLWNQNPDFFSYTLSKAALEAAGTMLALALAPQLQHYGGLSGVLHAGVAVAALSLAGQATGRRRLIGDAVLAGLAGVVHVCSNRLANPFDLVGIEIGVIAAVVLGGARITGGTGTVTGTLLGVFLVVVGLVLAPLPLTRTRTPRTVASIRNDTRVRSLRPQVAQELVPR